MPTYDLHCNNCSYEWETFCFVDDRKDQKCPLCNTVGENVIKANSPPAVNTWKPITVNDIDINPIEITGKRMYKEELKKRGLSCRGLL